MIEQFEILGRINFTETIAIGNRIRELRLLRETFGPGRWRKLKGIALASLPNGRIRLAELHWYEAQGIGRKKLKIKRYLD